MYSLSSEKDGDEEEKAQRADRNHRAIRESVDDSTLQVRRVRIQRIQQTEAHAINPAASVQRHTGYSLSDICREQILIHGPITPIRQIMNRGLQSAVVQTPTVAHMENTRRMTNIPRQSNLSAEENSVGQKHQSHSRVPIGYPTSAQGRKTIRRVHTAGTPSGSSEQQLAEAAVPKHRVCTPDPAGTTARARRREATQQVGPPVQGLGSPSATDTKQRVAAKLPELGTLIWKMPNGSKITFIPATETEAIQSHEPETNAARFNPAEDQQTGYAMQQNLNAPTEDDRALKVGTGYAQPSTSASGEDQQDTPIYELHKGVQGDHNNVQEDNNKQDSALPSSCQMQHAPRSPAKVLPVAQGSKIVHPVSNVAGRLHTSIPPQQTTMTETADSSLDFTNPATAYVQDKSTQVNIGLVQQGDGPVQNPHDAQRGNTPSYNNPATGSGMPCTAGDTLDDTQRDGCFSLHDRLTAQEKAICEQLGLDPNACSILIPAGRCMISDWVPVDDVGMQQLDRSLKSVEDLLRKERNRVASGKRNWKAKSRAVAPADCEGEEGNAIGNQMSTKTGSDSAAVRPSMYEAQRGADCPAVHTCILDAVRHCYMCKEEASKCNVCHWNKEQGISNPAHTHTSKLASAVGTHLGLAQHGEDHSSGGSSLLQGRSSENSGVTYSCVEDTGLETTPTALHQQREISEVQRGHKRRSDPNELSPPAAKNQILGVLGPELQHLPTPLTSFFSQKNETDPLSVEQEKADDTARSEILSVNDGNILSCDATEDLHETSSDSEEAEISFGFVSESEETSGSNTEKDCHLILEEAETYAAEDEEEGEYDGGAYITAIPGKQEIAEEREIDFPHDVPQTDEEECNCNEHDNEPETDSDSELLVERDSDLELLVDSELLVERDTLRDATYNSSVKPRGSVGKKCEIVGTSRDILNTASSEPPSASNLQMGMGRRQ